MARKDKRLSQLTKIKDTKHQQAKDHSRKKPKVKRKNIEWYIEGNNTIDDNATTNAANGSNLAINAKISK